MDEQTDEISEVAALEKLRALITYTVKIKDLAKRFGVSSAAMSAILSGKKRMSDDMLKAIGVRCVVVYVIEAKPLKIAS